MIDVGSLLLGAILSAVITIILEIILPEKYRIMVRGFFNKIRLRKKKFEIEWERSYHIVSKKLIEDISTALKQNKYEITQQDSNHLKAITREEPCDRIDVYIDVLTFHEIEKEVIPMHQEGNRLHIKLVTSMKFKQLSQTMIALKSVEEEIYSILEQLPNLKIKTISTRVDASIRLENISELVAYLKFIYANKISGKSNEYYIDIGKNIITVSGPYSNELIKLLKNVLAYS